MKAETLLPLGKLDPGLRAPDVTMDLDRVAQEARLVDALGYHALLMEETKEDPFQVLAIAAANSERVHVGTSVAIAFARSPYVVAQAAWTAQKLSHGRFELGLGSQVRGHIRRRFGMQWHPAGPWMRDYVGAVRAIWESWQTQSKLDYDSERYQLNLTVPLFMPAPIEHPDIPIHLAAVKPHMARVAAEVADGVRLHPVCSPEYIESVILPAIAATRRDGFEVCLKPLIATAADDGELEQRVAIARQRLAFYISTPGYARAFEVFGLQDLCEQMASLSRAGRWDEMAALVDDELLHRCVVIAHHDDLAAEMKRRYGHLVERVEVSFPVTGDAERERLRSVIAELAA